MCKKEPFMTTISNVNQQYNRFETDKQKASAKRFINADDAKLNKMAHNTYKFNEGANDKKFSRNVSIAVNSLPLIAVASGLASKKGAAAAIKDGAYWGIALLAPKAINAVNNKLVNVSSKVKNAERNLFIIISFLLSLVMAYNRNAISSTICVMNITIFAIRDANRIQMNMMNAIPTMVARQVRRFFPTE